MISEVSQGAPVRSPWKEPVVREASPTPPEDRITLSNPASVEDERPRLSTRVGSAAFAVASLVGIAQPAAAQPVQQALLQIATRQQAVDLNTEPMRLGAQGDQVLRFQQALAYYKDVQPTAIFDEQTQAAVREFQGDNDIRRDGVVGARTYGVLWSKLFWEKGVAFDLNDASFYTSLPRRLKVEVDLSTQRATVIDTATGSAIRTYPISSGVEEYPTPVGTWRITEVRERPTWYPPASGWAEAEEITPPGPDNPLGPVKMRLGHSDVLFHGVPIHRFGSLGRTPSSHGCIRMYPQDAWELHKIIRSGTPVEVRAQTPPPPAAM